MKGIYKHQDKSYERKVGYYSNSIFHYMYNRGDKERRDFILSKRRQVKCIKKALKKDNGTWRKELFIQYENVLCEYKSSLGVYLKLII